MLSFSKCTTIKPFYSNLLMIDDIDTMLQKAALEYTCIKACMENCLQASWLYIVDTSTTAVPVTKQKPKQIPKQTNTQTIKHHQ